MKGRRLKWQLSQASSALALADHENISRTSETVQKAWELVRSQREVAEGGKSAEEPRKSFRARLRQAHGRPRPRTEFILFGNGTRLAKCSGLCNAGGLAEGRDAAAFLPANFRGPLSEGRLLKFPPGALPRFFYDTPECSVTRYEP